MSAQLCALVGKTARTAPPWLDDGKAPERATTRAIARTRGLWIGKGERKSACAPCLRTSRSVPAGSGPLLAKRFPHARSAAPTDGSARSEVGPSL